MSLPLFQSTMQLLSFFGASERDGGSSYYSIEETRDLIGHLPSHNQHKPFGPMALYGGGWHRGMTLEQGVP